MTLLFIALLVSLSADIFLTGTVAGFLIKKPKAIELIRLFVIPVAIPAIILLAGYYSGTLASNIFSSNESVWYGGTILFILSIKQLYDGLRLNKLKKTINPLDPKGLFLLSIFVGINTFFVGLALGFIGIKDLLIFRGISFFIFAIALGFLTGLRLKKLISFRFELVVAIVYLVSALIIVLNLT